MLPQMSPAHENLMLIIEHVVLIGIIGFLFIRWWMKR